MSQLDTPTPHADAQGAGPAAMSTPETLANIFFEPERTFESLRERPRFLVAGLILIALALGITALVMMKVDFTEFITNQITSGPNSAQMSDAQKQQALAFWSGPLGAVFVYVMPVVASIVLVAAGAGLYLLAALAMGGRLRYKQALAVWVYSSFPPAVLGSLVAVVLLFVKAKEDIDLGRSGAGLAVSNLGALLGKDSSPALRAALGWFDVFTFYGIFLAALGLRKVAKLSSASAWTIVIVFWLVAMLFSAGWAAAFG